LDARTGDKRVVQIAQDIASNITEEMAQDTHRSGDFPEKAYEVLSKAGLLCLTVPKEYGGLGANIFTQVSVIWEIARVEGALANLLTMHSTTQTFIAALASDSQKSRLFEEVVNEGKFTAAATSEPGQSFQDQFRLQTSYTPTNKGYIFRGVKHFCSGFPNAHRVLVLAGPDAEGSAKGDFLVASILRRRVHPTEHWKKRDPLGMRGTASDSFSIDNILVKPKDIIGDPGALLSSGLFVTYALCYTALYGAIGEAALEWTVNYIGNQSEQKQVKAAEKLAMLTEQIQKVKDLLAEACCAFVEGRKDVVLLIARAKLAACTTSMEVVRETMQIIGGSSIFSTVSPHSRLLCDGAVGEVMPPSNSRCKEVIARIESGEENVSLLEFA
jgi:alkylation response protein AidB-like acyl-CoA dehydrogenase